jgi:hypothetical protein
MSGLRRVAVIDGDRLCWEGITGEVVVELAVDGIIDLCTWESRRRGDNGGRGEAGFRGSGRAGLGRTVAVGSNEGCVRRSSLEEMEGEGS